MFRNNVIKTNREIMRQKQMLTEWEEVEKQKIFTKSRHSYIVVNSHTDCDENLRVSSHVVGDGIPQIFTCK